MSEVVQVLREDPELAESVPSDERVQAAKECTARALPFREGEWSPLHQVGEIQSGIGLLVLEGMVVRRISLAGRFGAELLGEGDLLRPWEEEDSGPLPLGTGRWRVLRAGRVAVLDREFARCAAPHPEVISALLGRAVRRSRQLAVLVAIIHQPRIDVRLHMLLWQLASRWGHVHRDGIHLTVRLTHSMLSELVAARRPTVTKALGELADRGAVVWAGEHWLLTGRPPSELEALGEFSVGGPGGRPARAA